jgi:PKD repeat protein
VRRGRWGIAGLIAGVVATAVMLSCTDALAPLSFPKAPTALSVRAVGTNAVRITWKTVQDANVMSYQVQRRENQTGPFVPLPTLIPQSAMDMTVFVDTDVKPETFYGYRVVSVTRTGDASPASIVGGARTPPPPGIVVQTETHASVPDALDPDGYSVVIQGPDSVGKVLGLDAQERFAPLKSGQYKTTLRGIIDRCEVADDSVRTLAVVDTGVATLTYVNYVVRCRDPHKGRIVITVDASGDSADVNGFRVVGTGILSNTNLPDSLRVVPLQLIVPAAGGTVKFDDLGPGSYELELTDLDSHCKSVGTGPLKRTIAVAEASTDTLRYGVLCESQRPDDSGRPIALKSEWSLDSAAAGQTVFLNVGLDATARPDWKIAGAQLEVRFDPALLRYDSSRAAPQGGLDDVVANPGLGAGLLAFVATHSAGTGLSGTVPMVRAAFTVIGPTGQLAATRTRITELDQVIDAGTRLVQDSARIVEDTLKITAVGGGNVKTPPVSQPGGPYSGRVGTALSFSGSGSSDPDGGALTSYKWDFGDGSAEVTLPSSSTTHTYSSAGTFAVTLTVTDDESVTATAQSTATITNETTDPAKPFVWRNTWSAASAGVGAKLTLTSVLDATALPTRKMASVDARIGFDTLALRYDSATAVTPNGLLLTSNKVKDELLVSGIDPNGLSGVVGVAKAFFTVVGTSPGSVTTRTTLNAVADNAAIYELKDSVRIVEGTVTLGGGGTTKAPPIASPNGPYVATIGQAVAFSSAGSMDPDGGAVTYSWNFGDNSAAATTASPTHVYGSAGTYTVTLTVTDDESVNTSATTTATVSVPQPPPQLLKWQYTWSVVNDTLAVLEVLYDLQSDIPETPGAESLKSWDLDSLKWDPAVLRFLRVSSLGKTGGGSSQDFAPIAKVSVHGQDLSAPFNQGLVQLATLQFRIVGSHGMTTTTQTFLGALKNASGFDYQSKTSITEETFVVP